MDEARKRVEELHVIETPGHAEEEALVALLEDGTERFIEWVRPMAIPESGVPHPRLGSPRLEE